MMLLEPAMHKQGRGLLHCAAAVAALAKRDNVHAALED